MDNYYYCTWSGYGQLLLLHMERLYMYKWHQDGWNKKFTAVVMAMTYQNLDCLGFGLAGAFCDWESDAGNFLLLAVAPWGSCWVNPKGALPAPWEDCAPPTELAPWEVCVSPTELAPWEICVSPTEFALGLVAVIDGLTKPVVTIMMAITIFISQYSTVSGRSSLMGLSRDTSEREGWWGKGRWGKGGWGKGGEGRVGEGRYMCGQCQYLMHRHLFRDALISIALPHTS